MLPFEPGWTLSDERGAPLLEAGFVSRPGVFSRLPRLPGVVLPMNEGRSRAGRRLLGSRSPARHERTLPGTLNGRQVVRTGKIGRISFSEVTALALASRGKIV
jgi:hypothetical protein